MLESKDKTQNNFTLAKNNITLNPMGIMATIREHYGPMADADGYKGTHAPLYPKGSKRMVSYIESRGGKYDKVMFFGIQMLVKEHFMQKLTHTHVDNIIAFESVYLMGADIEALELALRTVVDEYDGIAPIQIRAAQEGMLIPTNNVLVSVESTVDDERVFSLVSYFETKLLRVWSPTTVATESYNIRQECMKALKITSEHPEEIIDYMLVDFGSRGTPADAAAAFAGSGHLVSFKASDTKIAIIATNIAYHAKMSAYTIPATEHSVTTAHGPEGEEQLLEQMFDKYAKPGAKFATVIDSYNWKNFIYNIAPKFKQRLIDSGAHWVFRPDSGDAIKTPIEVVRDLAKVFGYTTNKKGYKILNNVSVIQGDGIDSVDLKAILQELIDEKWCVSNMAFGMGGGLLQKNDRDTQKFAMKCCAVLVGDEWVDVYKSPAVFDPDTWEIDEEASSFKKSKPGRLELLYNEQTGAYETMPYATAKEMVGTYGWTYALDVIYRNGRIVRDMTLDQIRENAGTL